MSEEFKAIETQEAFDQAISERINREKEKYSKLETEYNKLLDEKSNLETKIEELQTGNGEFGEKIEALQSEINGYKQEKLKNSIAFEYGIPHQLSGRLVGEDEDALRADARALSDLIKSQQQVPPLKETETKQVGDSKEMAYRSLANTLFTEGE